jgi:hypothetical protein
MQKFSFLVFLLSISLTSICQVSNWHEDIDYFESELAKNHIDFYSIIDSVDFHNRLSVLKEKTDFLTDYEVELELQRILASLHISHTSILVQFNQSTKRLPLIADFFDDGLFIVGINKSNREFIGRKIIGINNIPIEEIYSRTEPFVSFENKQWLNRQFPYFISNVSFLKYIGVVKEDSLLTVNLDNQVTINFKAGLENLVSETAEVFNTSNWLKNRTRNYWFYVDNTCDLVYIQYNRCQEDTSYLFVDFVNDILKSVKEDSVNRILIDLRLNSGGDSEVFNPLIFALKELKNIEVYTAISKKTFSSGRMVAIKLRNQINSILIGENTGGSPRSYGNLRQIKLPNHTIVVNYCTKYFSLEDTNKNTTEPDIKVRYLSTDFFDGNDKILDKICNLNEP